MIHYVFNRHQTPRLLEAPIMKYDKHQNLDKEDFTEKWYKNSKPCHFEVKENTSFRILEDRIK